MVVVVRTKARLIATSFARRSKRSVYSRQRAWIATTTAELKAGAVAF
jgi:hypothetical protein